MRRFIISIVSVLAIAGITVGNARVTHAAVPADTLYASFTGLITIDQSDGSVTHLRDSIVLLGLAFDSTGRLFDVEQLIAIHVRDSAYRIAALEGRPNQFLASDARLRVSERDPGLLRPVVGDEIGARIHAHREAIEGQS